MRLNLGCGHGKLPGWLNVDSSPQCEPDMLVDLETFPWPFEESSADEVLLSHVLEHLGQAPKVYLGVMSELHRVCKPEARVQVVVPHPRHEAFVIDPTHVRPITAAGLQMFSQAKNREWIEKGAANTPLGLQLGIDFEIAKATRDLDPEWQRRVEAGEVTDAELREAMRSRYNVIAQTSIELRAVK